MPDFTIITPLLNGLPHLREMSESIDKQSAEVEWIVVDGGSVDGSLEFLASTYAHVISKPGSSIYEAINIALEEANGKYIAVLNADDRYLSNTLDMIQSSFEETGSDIICADVLRARTVLGKERYTYGPARIAELWKTMSINHPAMFATKKAYDRIGLYDTRYKVSADYDWVLRAVKAELKFEHLPKAATVFRLGGKSSEDCTSYIEGLKIHESHASPHIEHMRAMLERCRKGKSSFFNILEYAPFRWLYHIWLLRKWKAMDID